MHTSDCAVSANLFATLTFSAVTLHLSLAYSNLFNSVRYFCSIWVLSCTRIRASISNAWAAVWTDSYLSVISQVLELKLQSWWFQVSNSYLSIFSWAPCTCKCSIQNTCEKIKKKKKNCFLQASWIWRLLYDGDQQMTEGYRAEPSSPNSKWLFSAQPPQALLSWP